MLEVGQRRQARYGRARSMPRRACGRRTTRRTSRARNAGRRDPKQLGTSASVLPLGDRSCEDRDDVGPKLSCMLRGRSAAIENAFDANRSCSTGRHAATAGQRVRRVAPWLVAVTAAIAGRRRAAMTTTTPPSTIDGRTTPGPDDVTPSTVPTTTPSTSPAPRRRRRRAAPTTRRHRTDLHRRLAPSRRPVGRDARDRLAAA